MIPVYSANVDSGFEHAVLESAKTIGAVDPREVLVLLFAETSVTPSADHHVLDANGNLVSRFVGVNQFYVSVKNPGRDTYTKAVPDMPPDAYLALPASVQLARYVTPFWSALRAEHGPSATSTATDLYWVNFLPDTYVPNAPDSFVLTDDPGIVKHNASLARGKSFITKGDLAAFLVHRQRQEPKRWGELLDRVEVAMGLRPDPLGTIFNPSPSKLGIGLGLFLAVAAGGVYALTRKV